MTFSFQIISYTTQSFLVSLEIRQILKIKYSETLFAAKLYVDLSKSKIQLGNFPIVKSTPHSPNLQYDPFEVNNYIQLRRRDSDAFSEDSRVFNFTDNSLDIFHSLSINRSGQDMDRSNRLRSCSYQSTWRKYYCAICE